MDQTPICIIVSKLNSHPHLTICFSCLITVKRLFVIRNVSIKARAQFVGIRKGTCVFAYRISSNLCLGKSVNALLAENGVICIFYVVPYTCVHS